jgi:hypothetical protein
MIQAGMTEAEVEGIFGVPAGEYDWAVATTPGIWVEVMAYSATNSRWNANEQVRPRIVPLNGKEAALLQGSWNDVGPRRDENVDRPARFLLCRLRPPRTRHQLGRGRGRALRIPLEPMVAQLRGKQAAALQYAALFA